MGPSVTKPPERRRHRRAAVEFAVTFSRPHGGPVPGRTLDLGPDGTRVRTRRPLRVDELLAFDLSLGDSGGAVHGRARVVRQHSASTYAVRFEDVDSDGVQALERFVAPGA
jgi:PilZ domain